jgi:cystathionine gamma-synthase
MSYYETPPADRKRYGIPDNMIRLACGIENAEDLIADLEQALAKAPTVISPHPMIQRQPIPAQG